MPDLQPEIHVGDIGTLYRARVFDAGLPLDPSAAVVSELVFRLPGSVVLRKAATVVSDGLSPPVYWFLEYQVTAAAGAGSPPGEFHALAGPVKIQAYLEWADGSQFHSDVRTSDEDGQELRIYRNLDE